MENDKNYAPLYEGGGHLLTIVAAFLCLRILTLTVERVSLNRLGKSGHGALATMAIGFGGAAIILVFMSLFDGIPIPFAATFWTGALYALAFGLYTASFVKGPIGLVSPWSNATVVLLWIYRPIDSTEAWWGLLLFAVGVLILTHRQFGRAVVMMLASDAVLAVARLMDVSNNDHAPIAYAAGVFMAISVWMLIPLFVSRQYKHVFALSRLQPGWAVVAATSNAAAYLSVFTLLKWLHPAVVEAFSALASSLVTFVGVFAFHEKHGLRKLLSSILVTAGTILLLLA